MNLVDKIINIGLSKNQARVYLACLESGPLSAQSICLKTNIKRTTVYDLVESLKRQGLVSETIKGKKRLFVAENPSTLKEQLQKKEKEVDQILPELQSLYSVTGPKPKIKYYEGIVGIKKVLEDTLSSQEKILRSILPVDDIIKLLGEEYFDYYTQQRIAKKYKLLTIRPKSKEPKKIIRKYNWVTSQKDMREVRYCPPEFSFSMTMYFYDNKVSLISSKKESFGMLIESEEFAINQKYLFEVLWQVSKKIIRKQFAKKNSEL